jgi:hypothetical protein
MIAHAFVISLKSGRTFICDMELPATHPSKSVVFFHFWFNLVLLWSIVCTVILIVLQALKIYNFPAPPAHRDFSMCAPFLWFLLAIWKVLAGKAGNRSEHLLITVTALVAAIGAILFEVYFLIWQPYLWYWEQPLHITSIVFDGITIIFLIILIILFAMK